MKIFRLRREAQAGHERVERELAAQQEQIVDMTARLVRLEAEVESFRPFLNDQGEK